MVVGAEITGADYTEIGGRGRMGKLGEVTRKVILEFPSQLVDRPVVWNLSTAHGLVFNILRAKVDDGHGLLVLELRGRASDYEAGIRYLEDLGVRVELLEEKIDYNRERCTDCGACLAICPTRSFQRDSSSMEITFNQADCIACGMCVKACPARAIRLQLDH